MNIVLIALKEAEHLLLEEYQSVIDDDLCQKYDSVLEKFEIEIKQIKKS
jgi:hypothetical protein